MPHKTSPIARGWLLLSTVVIIAPAAAWGNYSFPSPQPPEEYGNLLIRRGSVGHDIWPATFSHWIHRQKHTCRVCHFELQFTMEVNTTEITEAANRAGMFCGACHDGKELFGHIEEEDCEKCHNADPRRGSDKYGYLWRLPQSKYGNKIDWVAALEEGGIQPIHQLYTDPYKDMDYEKVLKLQSKWSGAKYAIFPHDKHIAWLDCNDCHPYIFSIKERSTKGFSMTSNIRGNYCGVCHGKVAFPMTNCVRCHPSMELIPDYPEPELREAH